MAKITRIKASDGPSKEDKSDAPTITRKKVVVKDKKSSKSKAKDIKKAAKKSIAPTNQKRKYLYYLDHS